MRVYTKKKKNYYLVETRCEWRDDTQLPTPPSSAAETGVCAGAHRFKTRAIYPIITDLFLPLFPVRNAF